MICFRSSRVASRGPNGGGFCPRRCAPLRGPSDTRIKGFRRRLRRLVRGTFLARKVPKNALHDARARLRRVPCGAPVRRGPQNSRPQLRCSRSNMLRPFFRRPVRASGGRDGGANQNRARGRASSARSPRLRNQNRSVVVVEARFRNPGLHTGGEQMEILQVPIHRKRLLATGEWIRLLKT